MPQAKTARAAKTAKQRSGKSDPVVLLVGTRKGAFMFRSDASRRRWQLQGPLFLGNIVYHFVADPRRPARLLVAARTGHLGPTIFISDNFGKRFREAKQPPAFPKAPEGTNGRAVNHVFWITPGHASEPDVFYAGTSPQALFRSEDAGDTWQSISGFNDHPQWSEWTGAGQGGTPDGPKLHSILVDPRDPAHLYVGLSGGGVFESVDGGADWQPLNAGCAADFLPDPAPAFGHDPHCVRLHPLAPDVLYQQNHCGIYRMQRSEGRWVRIGERMPKSVGDIGFPMVLHPRDPDAVWVFPMDGSGVWPRTSPDGKPAVYVTRNAGRRWQRQDQGLPEQHAWLTVLRQAMTADTADPVGVYFGTTSGQLWGSRDEGARWTRIAEHLPQVYSVETASAPA